MIRTFKQIMSRNQPYERKKTVQLEDDVGKSHWTLKTYRLFSVKLTHKRV